MRALLLTATLLLSTALAHAQTVSPLGGSARPPVATPPAAQVPGTPATAAPTATTPASPSVAAPAPSTTAPATTEQPTSSTSRHGHRMTQRQRFEASNTTHDGKLTLEQARAGHMRAVVRDFDKIDTAKRGYVSWDDIRAYRAKVRASRRSHSGSSTPAASE